MNDTKSNDIDNINTEYSMVVRTMPDVLYHVSKDPMDRLICESIIDNLEETAANAVLADKVVQLPYIGCIRRNPIKLAIKAQHINFSAARKVMTTDQYKDHVREVIIDVKENQIKLDKNKSFLKKFKAKNQKKYDSLYIRIGKGYADMYIQSLLMFKEIPFDIEVQQHFDNLNGY